MLYTPWMVKLSDHNIKKRSFEGFDFGAVQSEKLHLFVVCPPKRGRLGVTPSPGSPQHMHLPVLVMKETSPGGTGQVTKHISRRPAELVPRETLNHIVIAKDTCIRKLRRKLADQRTALHREKGNSTKKCRFDKLVVQNGIRMPSTEHSADEGCSATKHLQPRGCGAFWTPVHGGWAEPAAIREHGGPRPALLPRPGIAAKVCPAVCHQTCCSFKPVSKLRAAIQNAFNGNPFPFILACLRNESSQRCVIYPEQSPVVCSMSATDSDLDPGFPLQWPKHLNPLGLGFRFKLEVALTAPPRSAGFLVPNHQPLQGPLGAHCRGATGAQLNCACTVAAVESPQANGEEFLTTENAQDT